MKQVLRQRCAVMVFGLGLFGGWRSFADFPDPVLRVEASNDAGVAGFSVTFADGEFDSSKQIFRWTLKDPVDLIDPLSEATIARLTSAKLVLRGGDRKAIELDWGLTSGDSRTEVSFYPGLLEFDLPDEVWTEAKGKVSASVVDEGNNGAELRALGNKDSGVMRAEFNGEVPNGATYCRLLGTISIGPGGIGSAWQSQPAYGFERLLANATNISSWVRFDLTAGDKCSGQSRYEIRYGRNDGTYYADDDGDNYGDVTKRYDGSYPPDHYVPQSGDCNDADSSVNPDAREFCNGVDDDCDGEIDDGCDDRDDDGVIDNEDNCPCHANPEQEDRDGDGAGDACDWEQQIADMNCDGAVTFTDIDGFALALVGEREYLERYPNCNWYMADMNRDCEVDFSDITPFISCVNGDCD